VLTFSVVLSGAWRTAHVAFLAGSGRAQGRRAIGAAILALMLASLLPVSSSAGQAALVPAELQAELLAKLVRYDRNFEARAGSEVVVLVVVRPKTPESTLAGNIMKSALSRVERIGGRPHREVLADFTGAPALAEKCRKERASVVYLTPGLDAEIPAVASALDGVDILSLAAVPDYVPRGVVLGFELVSGKPKLLLNLPQAKRQRVDFSVDVLKLMKVYR
jgi:hypothetical protein